MTTEHEQTVWVELGALREISRVFDRFDTHSQRLMFYWLWMKLVNEHWERTKLEEGTDAK